MYFFQGEGRAKSSGEQLREFALLGNQHRHTVPSHFTATTTARSRSTLDLTGLEWHHNNYLTLSTSISILTAAEQ